MKRKEGKRGYVVGEEARRGIGVKAKRYATAAVHFTRYERSRRCQRCIFNSSIESATFDSVTRLDRTLTFFRKFDSIIGPHQQFRCAVGTANVYRDSD